MVKKYDAYLVGYYGMANSGDDALMCSAHWGARTYLNSPNILTTSATDIDVPGMGQVNAMPRGKFRGHQRLSHYKNALQSAKVIFGGGSVIHSQRDITFKRHLIKLAGAKESRCVGVGIEKFESVEAEKSCAKLLNECGFVGVRDKNSFEIATSLAPGANIKLTFDLAPTMLNHGVHNVVPIERNGIMFNFCQLPINAFGDVDNVAEKQRIEAAIDLVTQCWDKLGEPIYLLDFNGHPVFGDVHVHDQILQRIPKHVEISHIRYDPNPYRVLQRIAGFKAVAAMRLHAAIMSFMVETPCMSINYHQKCVGWCEQVGVPNEYRFNANKFCAEHLSSVISKGVGMGFAKPTMSVDTALQAALLNWR